MSLRRNRVDKGDAVVSGGSLLTVVATGLAIGFACTLVPAHQTVGATLETGSASFRNFDVDPGGAFPSFKQWRRDQRALRDLKGVVRRVQESRPRAWRLAPDQSQAGQMAYDISDPQYIQDLSECFDVLFERGTEEWAEISNKTYFAMQAEVLEVLLEKASDPVEQGILDIRENLSVWFNLKATQFLTYLEHTESAAKKERVAQQYLNFLELTQRIVKSWPTLSSSSISAHSLNTQGLFREGVQDLKVVFDEYSSDRIPLPHEFGAAIRSIDKWVDRLEAYYDPVVRDARSSFEEELNDRLASQRSEALESVEVLAMVDFSWEHESEAVHTNSQRPSMIRWIRGITGYATRSLQAEYASVSERLNPYKPEGSKRASSDPVTGSDFGKPGWTSESARRARGDGGLGSKAVTMDLGWLDRLIRDGLTLGEEALDTWMSGGNMGIYGARADDYVRRVQTEINAHSELFRADFVEAMNGFADRYRSRRERFGNPGD